MTIARTTTILLVVSAAAHAQHADFLPSPALHEAGLTKFWQLNLPLDPGQRLTDLHLVDDQLFAVTEDGYAFAIDAYTGAPRWMRQVTRSGYRLAAPARAGDRAVFVTPSAFTQFDWYLGTPIEQFDLRFPAGSPPRGAGDFVFVGGIDQRFYAFSVHSEYERWKVVTGGQVLSRPVLHGGHLFFASDSGRIFACMPLNKRRLWIRRLGGSVTADLVADDNGIYVASRDNSLYLLDPVAGGIRWRARLSGPLYEPPAISHDLAFQYCPDDGLVAINTAGLGEVDRIRWRLPQGRRLLTSDARFAYVMSRDERLLAVRLSDGSVVHEIDAFGFRLGPSIPEARVFYIASPDGRVFCGRGADSSHLTREQVLAALRVTRPTTDEAEEPETAAAPPTTPPAEETLRTREPGPPIGGRSKISRQFGRE